MCVYVGKYDRKSERGQKHRPEVLPLQHLIIMMTYQQKV